MSNGLINLYGFYYSRIYNAFENVHSYNHNIQSLRRLQAVYISLITFYINDGRVKLSHCILASQRSDRYILLCATSCEGIHKKYLCVFYMVEFTSQQTFTVEILVVNRRQTHGLPEYELKRMFSRMTVVCKRCL